jgi:SlyX protein
MSLCRFYKVDVAKGLRTSIVSSARGKFAGDRAFQSAYIGSMNEPSAEKRFIDIETKILHQEIILEDLHKVVVDQQEKLQNLEATLAVLVKRLRNSSSGEHEIGPHNEKPPHY